MFKIGTDALILGAWIPKIVDNALYVLDVGTGTGVLALMMAFYFENAEITAIDQEDASVVLAESNFKHSLWSERLAVKQENIFDDSNSEKNKFDLVLCNPPFFYNQLEAKIEVKAKAKHAAVSSQIWMEAFLSRLNSSGHLCIVVPFDTAYDWITSANQCGLYCQDRMDIYSFQADAIPGRSLLHFHTELRLPEIVRLDIYESYNRYTKAYLDFTKISQYPDRTKKTDQTQ